MKKDGKILIMKKIFFFVLSLFLTPAYAEEFSLFDLQNLVIKESPRLKSMELETEMMRRRIPVSSALEDPKLKIGINSVPLDSWSFKEEDMTTKEIGISQMIPLGGKLGIKESIAIKEYEKSKERLRKEKVEMLHMLRMNVYELFYIKSSLKILEEIKDYLKLLIESESAATKSGMGSLTNIVKANIEYTMVNEEIISLRQKEAEAKKKLSYLTGLTEMEIDIKMDDFSWVELVDINPDEIREKIFQNNPDLRLLAIEKEISEKEVTLRQKEYYPDLEIGISYMQRDDSPLGMKRPDMVSAMAVLNIPIWYKKKNIPMIEEMQKKHGMVDSSIKDKKNELVARLDTISSQLKKWKELYRLYKDELIPQNELALETILARYKTSSVEFMPVIDTIRMLLKYKKETVMIQKEYLINISELNSLMGVEVIK